jgi:hypothetical protein
MSVEEPPSPAEAAKLKGEGVFEEPPALLVVLARFVRLRYVYELPYLAEYFPSSSCSSGIDLKVWSVEFM